MTKKLPNLVNKQTNKPINLQIREAEEISNRINSKILMPRLIRMKLLKSKDKKTKLLKGAREKPQLTMRKKCSHDSGFLIRIQKEVAYHFSGDDSKHTHPRTLYLAKYPLGIKEKLRHSQTKEKKTSLSPAHLL